MVAGLPGEYSTLNRTGFRAEKKKGAVVKTKHYLIRNRFRILLFVLLYPLILSLIPCIQPPTCHAAQITLSWDANTETDIAGYKIYYGSSSGNYETTIDIGNTTTCVLEEAPADTTYFAVKAYNTSGFESDFSDEVIYAPVVSTTTTQPVTTTTTTQPVTTTTTTIQLVTTTTTTQPVTTTTTTQLVTTTTTQPVTTTTTAALLVAYVPTDYGTIQEAVNSVAEGGTVYIEDNATYDGFTITKNFITVKADTEKNAKPVINGASVTVGDEAAAIYIAGDNATIQGLTINSENVTYTKTVIVDSAGSILKFNVSPLQEETSTQLKICGVENILWWNKNAGAAGGWNECSPIDVDSDGCLVLTADTEGSIPSLGQLSDTMFGAGRLTISPTTTTTTVVSETTSSGGSSSGGGGGGGGTATVTVTDNQTSTTSGCTADSDCSNGLFCNAGTGMCVECVTDSQCDDGIYCNGTESCSNNMCLPGDNPCEDETFCDEENKTCTSETDAVACTTDADCSDGVFCNGEEQCSDGQCVAGEQPCGENQQCDETQEACLDSINMSTADLINKPRKPVFKEKIHQWLVLFYAGDININESVTTVTIEGDDSDFHGVERDTSRPCYQLFNYIFVPVYIYRDATAGQWTIVIQAKEKDSLDTVSQRMEASFQIQ